MTKFRAVLAVLLFPTWAGGGDVQRVGSLPRSLVWDKSIKVCISDLLGEDTHILGVSRGT